MSAQSKHVDELIKRIALESDEKAFKDLFNLFYGKLYEISRIYTRSNYAAQDVVSRVFVKLWNNRKTLYPINSVNAYLFIAVKRQSFNYLRDNHNHTQISIDELETDIAVENKTPDQVLISQEVLEILHNAIQKLPDKCRLVYTMVKEDGLKYREVSDILNISVKAVEMHVGKALKRIRLEFEQYLEKNSPLY